MISDVVWSINIMCAILLVGVAICIYWIFKYDDWYPNPITPSHTDSSDGSHGSFISDGAMDRED